MTCWSLLGRSFKSEHATCHVPSAHRSDRGGMCRDKVSIVLSDYGEENTYSLSPLSFGREEM